METTKKIAKPISISITIPAFNEEATIKEIILQTEKEASALSFDFEIVIIDDGSTDSTKKIVQQLARRKSRVRIFSHSQNRGFSGAFISCCRNARKDLIFIMPADGQISPRALPQMIAQMKNSDVVLGFARKRNDPFYRRFNSYLFHFLARHFFGVNFRQISLCNLYRRKFINQIIFVSSPGSAFLLLELTYKLKKMGAKFKEVEIEHLPRRFGQAKGANPKTILLTLRDMLKFWSQEKLDKLKRDVVSRRSF